MDKKTQQKEMKALAVQLLENNGISYDDWLMEQHSQVISQYSGDILKALKHASEKNKEEF